MNRFVSRVKGFIDQQLIKSVLFVVILATYGCQSVISEVDRQAFLDCPLRDEPFSTELTVIDTLLSPTARVLLDAEFPQLLAHMPPNMLKTEAPSFAAITSVRGLASMKRLPEETIQAIDARLRTLEVTDADRQARCLRYDNHVPEFIATDAEVRVLVFDKINGFDHGVSVDAATQAFKELGDSLGWSVSVTDKGGAFNKKTLSLFDVIVWNNVSGDVLTLSQREAFKRYIESGGAYLGIHGSGGDSIHFWRWYVDTLLGATFIGHPMNPQFQEAAIHIEPTSSAIGQSNAPGWRMTDEWYSFSESARKTGANVIATLDESTYKPSGMFGQDLRMGEDHPIVWTRCIANGRAFYSAIGHRPEVYELPENRALLKDALLWTAGKGKSVCRNGSEIPR